MRTFGKPSDFAVLFVRIIGLLPKAVGDWLYECLGGDRIKFAKRTSELSERVARHLVSEKNAAISRGIGGKDILSLCIKFNSNQESQEKMSETEIISQLQSVRLVLLLQMLNS
jgi:hypothetical protein